MEGCWALSSHAFNNSMTDKRKLLPKILTIVCTNPNQYLGIFPTRGWFVERPGVLL